MSSSEGAAAPGGASAKELETGTGTGSGTGTQADTETELSRTSPAGSSTEDHHARRIAGSAIVLSSLSGLALLLTLVWQLSIAAYFGTTSELDAFWIALAMPKAVVDSFHLGILTLLFILVFNLGAKTTDEDRSRLASSLFNLVLLSNLVLVPAFILGAPWLVRWMAPGLTVEQVDLAARLMPRLSLLLLPTAVTGGLAGVLHAHQRFVPFALSRVIGVSLQIGILSVLVLRIGVDALVWALLLGALVMLIFCLPSFLRTDFRYRPILRFEGREARAIFGLFVALAGFALLERLNQMSDRFFASMLPAGSVSALEFGWRFEIPVSQVLSFSIALPSFAIMAVQAAEDRLFDFRRTVLVSVRLVALLVVPLVGFLVVLRNPIVDLWFRRGSFSPEAASLVASLIPPLAIIFLLRAFGVIMLFGLLSTRKHKPLLVILFLEVVANTILNSFFVKSMGLQGVVLATALAMLVANLWLWALLLRPLKSWSFQSLGEGVWKPVAVGVASTAILQAAYWLLLSGRFSTSGKTLAFQLAGIGLTYVVLHFAVGRLSGVIDARFAKGVPRFGLFGEGT
jgi:putative peptidoglycan lipid II flippase